MKKVAVLILMLCLVASIPILAAASSNASLQPDAYADDGTPIYYITVSPEV